MLLSDLAEIVMLESGEFLLDDMSEVEIQPHKFWRIVKRELALFQKHVPVTKEFNLNIRKIHTFTEDGEHGIPEWISRIVPSSHVKSPIFRDWNFSSGANYRGIDKSPFLQVNKQFISKYDKPKLYVADFGIFDLTAHYNYEIIETKNDQNVITEVDIVGLEEHKTFVDMIVAKFMIALGRSRRAFTLNDLPVQMDGSELVSEGQELHREALELLYETNKWHYALGE